MTKIAPIYTSFDEWPAYMMSESIFAIRFILWFLFRARSAIHNPTTASKLGLFRCCLPVDSNSNFRVGVYLTNSDVKVIHLNDFSSDGSVCWRMELVSLEHSAFSSPRISLQISFKTFFLIHSSFRHSIAIVFLLRRAIAFPRCFRLGVNLKLLGLL